MIRPFDVWHEDQNPFSFEPGNDPCRDSDCDREHFRLIARVQFEAEPVIRPADTENGDPFGVFYPALWAGAVA